MVVAVVVLEELKKEIERYNNRRHDLVYCHMLEKPVYYWLKEPKVEINNYMLLGELVHIGVERLLERAEPVIKTIYLPCTRKCGIKSEVWNRFVKYDRNKRLYYIVLSGSADALWGTHPVELKTTRRNIKKPKWEWELRCKLYAYLYNSPCVLSILNLVSGEELVVHYSVPPEHYIHNMVYRWLRGEFPYKTL